MQPESRTNNVVDLAEARRKREVSPAGDKRPAHRGRVVRVGGYVLVGAAAIFGAYFVFRAAELGLLTDTVALSTFAVPVAYAIFGAMLIRLAGQMQVQPRLAAAGASAAGNVVASRSHEANGASIILPFRQVSFASSGLLSLTCTSCGSVYVAYSADESCTACNRRAAAG